MAKQYLDWNKDGQYGHWIDVDEVTGSFEYGVTQDVSKILDANQAEYNADHGRWGELTKVASIPIGDFWQMVADGTINPDGTVNDQIEVRKHLRKILNDIDYRKLRTRPGNI
jgi:hypothetical protein